MARRVVTTTEEVPKETVVVEHEREVEDHPRSNAGLIIAVIIILLILIFLFVGNPFGRRGAGGTTNVNVPAPTTTTH